jgi:hypothetical protein
LGRIDGFTPTDADRDDGKRTWDQSVGEFLIDRDGVVRWLYLEGARRLLREVLVRGRASVPQ